jgi:hypothetical protein
MRVRSETCSLLNRATCCGEYRIRSLLVPRWCALSSSPIASSQSRRPIVHHVSSGQRMPNHISAGPRKSDLLACSRRQLSSHSSRDVRPICQRPDCHRRDPSKTTAQTDLPRLRSSNARRHTQLLCMSVPPFRGNPLISISNTNRSVIFREQQFARFFKPPSLFSVQSSSVKLLTIPDSPSRIYWFVVSKYRESRKFSSNT